MWRRGVVILERHRSQFATTNRLRTVPFAYYAVVPHPRFGIEWLAHAAKDPSIDQVMPFKVLVSSQLLLLLG